MWFDETAYAYAAAVGSDVAGLIDRDLACDALAENTQRLASLLRTVTDPSARAIGIWTIGDVANHVTWGIENYTRWLEDKDAPDLDTIANMSHWNAQVVRQLPTADLLRLADRIETATDRFIEVAGAKPPSTAVRWYAGNRIPTQVAVCMRLIEAAVHGFDIAQASNEKWTIDVDHARTMSYGLAYIAPYFVQNDELNFAGTMEVRIRGGAPIYYIVDRRSLAVATSAASIDWHLSADPVSWILVMTERRNQWLAASTGKIIGWGRRPLLPFKLRAASFQG